MLFSPGKKHVAQTGNNSLPQVLRHPRSAALSLAKRRLPALRTSRRLLRNTLRNLMFVRSQRAVSKDYSLSESLQHHRSASSSTTISTSASANSSRVSSPLWSPSGKSQTLLYKVPVAVLFRIFRSLLFFWYVSLLVIHLPQLWAPLRVAWPSPGWNAEERNEDTAGSPWSNGTTGGALCAINLAPEQQRRSSERGEFILSVSASC